MAKDRRIERTRELLFNALLDLIIEKGYDAITVQDLIENANIGRSTFYSHFQDKEHLLSENIKNLQGFLKQQSIEVKNDHVRFGFSLNMLQHAQSHRRIYKALAGRQGGIMVLNHMKNMLADLVKEEVENRGSLSRAGTVPLPVVVEFIVNTFFSLLISWMESKLSCTAIEVDEMFHDLVLNGLGQRFD